jgi:hypothetical protein
MLFRRCIREVERVERPNYPFHKRNKNFRLDILNGDCFRGRASVGGYLMLLKIPRNVNWDELKDNTWFNSKTAKESLAKLIIHEYYHTLGYSNWDKNHYKGDNSKQWNVDWVKDYLIREKEVVKKEQVDIKLVRYQQSIVNLRRAETRFKRAKTLYKKWFGKVKRYEVVYNFKNN